VKTKASAKVNAWISAAVRGRMANAGQQLARNFASIKMSMTKKKKKTGRT